VHPGRDRSSPPLGEQACSLKHMRACCRLVLHCRFPHPKLTIAVFFFCSGSHMLVTHSSDTVMAESWARTVSNAKLEAGEASDATEKNLDRS
jgi:hypothetical protein